MKAFILAGGKGERLRPLTEKIPKPLIKIKNRPILEWIILNLKKNGIKEITLLVGYKADKIKEYFKDGKSYGLKINYFVEKEPLGTGGGIKLLAKNLKEDFIMLNGDNLADFDFKKMVKEHKENKADVTIALYYVSDASQFGVAELDKKRIMRFIEKPKGIKKGMINAGAYIINPKVLEIMPEGKSSIEYDCFEKICKQGKVFAFIHKGKWFPTDNFERLNKAKKEW